MAAGESMLEGQFAKMSRNAYTAMAAAQYREAEKLLEDLIQLQRRALGPEHEDTLYSQIQLSKSLSFLERDAEAEAILREVLQVQQQSPSFGMEHEITLYTVGILGRCLVKQGRFKEAEPMLRKVHALCTRVLGPRHVETLDMQATLGNCLTKGCQFQEAEGLLRDVLEGVQTMEPVPGRADIKAKHVGSGMLDLAICIFKSGRQIEAESLLREAVKFSRHHVGEECVVTLNCMGWHASVLNKLGKHAAAEVMYRLAVQRRRAKIGWEHPDTLLTTQNFLDCLMAQRKLVAAEALLRDTLSHLQQTLGEDHPTVLEWMQDLAKHLQKQCHNSKRNEAKALLRRAKNLASNRQD